MATITGFKYIWRLPLVGPAAVLDHAARYTLPVPIMQALANRGLTGTEAIDSFLFTSREQNVAHPSLLKDADKAVNRIMQAIERGEKILVAGDYDVDGITSSALMLRCLQPLGAKINYFLPHRVHDGYGLSVKTIQRAADNGYSLIITVDNGITALEPAAEAKRRGIDLIITDHHRPYATLPDAYAIVDPHQLDCHYPFKYFAGVGISFKLMTLLYEKLGKELPAKAYELMLLGTVADVVPLQSENRFWVRHCLKHVNEKRSLSIDTLRANSRCTKEQLSSSDIGFFLAPQINALGRLDDARDGVKFLVGDDDVETERIGKVLGMLNEARKAVEQKVIADITDMIQKGAIDPSKKGVLIAASADWPPGVIGLAASRLVGLYRRPTIVCHITSDGLVKGSCRSMPEFNMFDALSQVSDLLKTFGGHAQAAGLSLPKDKLPELQERLDALVAAQLTDEDLKHKLYVDAELSLAEAGSDFMRGLAYCEPFGCANPVPSFIVRHVSLVEAPQLLKNAHTKCRVFSDGIIKPIIFFNRPDIYERLRERGSEPFSVVAHVVRNEWNGNSSIELQGLDAAYE